MKIREENVVKMEKLIEQKDKDKKRLEELRRIYEAEMTKNAEEESRIKKVFREREKIIKDQKAKEALIEKIQYYFEGWYNEIGQFVKPKKKVSKASSKSL